MDIDLQNTYPENSKDGTHDVRSKEAVEGIESARGSGNVSLSPNPVLHPLIPIQTGPLVQQRGAEDHDQGHLQIQRDQTALALIRSGSGSPTCAQKRSILMQSEHGLQESHEKRIQSQEQQPEGGEELKARNRSISDKSLQSWESGTGGRHLSRTATVSQLVNPKVPRRECHVLSELHAYRIPQPYPRKDQQRSCM